MAGFRSLRYGVLLFALAVCTACASVPSAVTVGQSTVNLKRHRHAVDRYLTDVHEAAHRRQYRERGVLPLLWSYFARPSERLRLEAEAHVAALCKAEELGAVTERLVHIHDRYTEWLQSYIPEKPISKETSRAYLDEIYQGGDGCAVLLMGLDDLPAPPPQVRQALLRAHRPPQRVAVLESPVIPPLEQPH